MPIRSQDLLLSRDHLRHQAQTCDWFLFSFRKIADEIAAEHGIVIALDEGVLRDDFSRWHGFFMGHKQAVKANRREFIIYAAGLMARELLRCGPAVRVEGLKRKDALALWPEGYCIFRYCAEVAAAILEEEYGEHPRFGASARALLFWSSLKENVLEDPRYAVPALKQLMGEAPDWKRMDLPPAGTPKRLGPLAGQRLH